MNDEHFIILETNEMCEKFQWDIWQVYLSFPNNISENLYENWREGEREGEGGAAGGVDRQKAALKLLNTPCIANNCVPQYFYPRCATIVLHTMRSTDEL